MTTCKLVVIAAALALALEARAAPTALGLSVDPRQVELVPGARATLRVTAPDMPLLAANVGHVERLRAVGEGVFEATYLPPRDTHPQVAIVVAISERGYAWSQIPLAGTGEVSVKPDQSGTATVTIGGQVFGPQRAGPDGRALIRIVVPPGIRQAVAGGKRMNLNTPDSSHVFTMVSRTAVAADAAASLLVRTFAVTAGGKPRRGAPLLLKASSGQLSAAREVEPGVFESTWTLQPGAAGSATVEASLRDEALSVSRAFVQREAAAARRIKLEFERSAFVAGEGTLDFTAAFEDGAGNPVDDVVPRATTSVGAFLGWTRGVPGRWTGRLSVPQRLNGDSTLVLVVSAGELTERREVTLRPGPTAELSVSSGGAPSGDGAPLALSVSTLDRFGNPSEDVLPEAKAELGVVEAPVRQGVGVYRVMYRPPASADAARDEITFRAGRAGRVFQVPLLRPSAPASASTFTLALAGGVAARSGAFGPAAGAEASLWSFAGGAGGLTLKGTWFSFSQKRSVEGPPGAIAFDAKASYLAFTGGPAWRWPLGSRLGMVASLGGGAVRAQSSSTLAGQPTIEEARWVAAGTAAVSLGARMWGGYPFLELRALYVADPRLAGLAGSFTPVLFQLGYRFDAL